MGGPSLYQSKILKSQMRGKKNVDGLLWFIHLHTYLILVPWNGFRHIGPTEIATKEVKDAARLIIDEIYHFNKQTQAEIENLMNSINIDGSYIGFYIRKVGKSTEMNLLDVNAHISKVESLTIFRKAFVSSDIKLIRELYTNWSFMTLTEKEFIWSSTKKYKITRVDKKHHNFITLVSLNYC